MAGSDATAKVALDKLRKPLALLFGTMDRPPIGRYTSPHLKH